MQEKHAGKEPDWEVTKRVNNAGFSKTVFKLCD